MLKIDDLNHAELKEVESICSIMNIGQDEDDGDDYLLVLLSKIKESALCISGFNDHLLACIENKSL